MGSIIKVNEYKDFNNNDIMTSDGAGVVTPNADGIKNVPAFLAVAGGSAQSIPNTPATKVTFTTEIYDTNSAYDASNSKFVVPTGMDGKYLIGAQFGYASNVNDLHVGIYVNGSNSFDGTDGWLDLGDALSAGMIACELDLDAADYVEIYTYQNTGGAVNSNSNVTRHKFFGSRLIGA